MDRQKLWWQMPGPAAFVSDIVRDFRSGKNVVIQMPLYSNGGLYSAIRTELGDSELWNLCRISCVDESNAAVPAKMLVNRFVPDASNDMIHNARNLVRCESFLGRLIWIEGIDRNCWPAWRDFLYDYQHICRGLSSLDRTLFCISLTGEPASQACNEDICLSVRRWSGIVSCLDMLLFTSFLFQDREIGNISKRTFIGTIAGLALWDPAIAELFENRELETVLNPVDLLRDFGERRGWRDIGEKSPEIQWQVGAKNFIDGIDRSHSAAVALAEDKVKIERRIWSAQVGILLPFIEERRQEILVHLEDFLEVPFITRFGEYIENIFDLEIGHIEFQLHNNGKKINPNLLNLVRNLREMRNSLTHMTPIGADFLQKNLQKKL